MHYYVDVLKRYTQFAGRASRTEFWMFTLFNFFVFLLMQFIGGLLALLTHVNVFMFLSMVYLLAVFLPSLTLTVRRLHDSGHSGWWALVGFIPMIGWIWLFILMVLPSVKDINDHAVAAEVVQSVAPMPSEDEHASAVIGAVLPKDGPVAPKDEPASAPNVIEDAAPVSSTEAAPTLSKGAQIEIGE